MIRKAAGITKGSSTVPREKVGVISRESVREIAQMKSSDLNASDVEAAMKIVEGTAKSMGVDISD